jgi:hypothetical protein
LQTNSICTAVHRLSLVDNKKMQITEIAGEVQD